jgi:fructosamine-3-kinase
VADHGLHGVFEAEARGLRWLAGAGAVPVPEVLGAGPGALVVSWVDSEPASPVAAERFGRDLALLHAAGADGFGAPWAGFIASLPLPNEPGNSWPEWYAARRLLPFARRAVDAGVLTPADARLVDQVAGRLTELAGPAEPPARLHGDCWSGNVLWSRGRGVLIDPAAHGGHRESDLAMLALFGAPYLDRILAAYDELTPLAGGWRQRVSLHQMHPLLAHACLFGAGYAGPVRDAARAALAAGG